VNPDGGDYHIGSGSGAIDTGVNAWVTTDIDGELRPYGLGYDIGADELGPALAVAKTATPDPVATGGHLTYTLRLTNTGTVSLTATVTDLLPSHVTPTGVLTWTPPSILPDDTWTETVVITVEMSYLGLLTNVVQVATEEGATGAYTLTSTVTDAPIAGLEATNDSPTMLGNPTTLTATISAGSNVTYTWAFGDNDDHHHPAILPHLSAAGAQELLTGTPDRGCHAREWIAKIGATRYNLRAVDSPVVRTPLGYDPL